MVKNQNGKTESSRQIEICGVEYTVTRGALPEGTIGECDPDRRIITVSSLASPEVYETTVLHECVHAGFNASGLEHLVSPEMQEAIVCMVEHTLFNAGFRLDAGNNRK